MPPLTALEIALNIDFFETFLARPAALLAPCFAFVTLASKSFSLMVCDQHVGPGMHKTQRVCHASTRVLCVAGFNLGSIARV